LAAGKVLVLVVVGLVWTVLVPNVLVVIRVLIG
jgi:hypothetical protein